MMPRTVAALFVRHDSVYKVLPGVDAWDIARDAREWPGGCPVVAHPPCRTWGRLSRFAKAIDGEHDLAPLAVEFARCNGGVVEHPASSRLWPECALPAPGAGADRFGGWTLGITQHWFGHRAEKRTLLYVVGVDPRRMPDMPPLILGRGERVIAPTTGRRRFDGSVVRPGDADWRMSVTHDEREATPLDLALWLVDLARRARVWEVAA